MFDKLIDLIISTWNNIVPYIIINEFERGVRLRFGKLKNKVMLPGIYFKIPVIDTVYVDIIMKDTLDIKEVNVTTIDDKTITVGSVLEFCIEDIILHTIFTNSAKGNIPDICRGIIAKYLMDCTYAQCKDKKTLKAVTSLISLKLEEMGVQVLMFSFTDMTISKVVKVFGLKDNI